MQVYVLNKNNTPLMPCGSRKARLLLKQGRAKVVKRTPFTIKLYFGNSGYKQEITLGVDAGSKTIGLSATSDTRELFSSEVELRNDIVKLLSTRRENRRNRRNRLRYRTARFNNRKREDNWLAPSVQHKIDTHLSVVKQVNQILPISKTIVEIASFDIQKIKNANIKGKEYQQGEQLDFWNVREYVLFRDDHKCQHCKGKSRDKILNVHHLESRKTGGNAPNNLVTLCETCHNEYHKGRIELTIKRGKVFKDATFLGIMRWSFYNELKKLYSSVSLTYGYITKNTRISKDLPKEHRVDARCITGNPTVKASENWYFIKKIRRHNRQIHKSNILKGGNKKLNQAPYQVKGFRLFDKVLFDNKESFVFGRRSSGYFDLRQLDGTSISKSANYKKLKLLEKRKNYIVERRITRD
jgi:hypothetical protein